MRIADLRRRLVRAIYLASEAAAQPRAFGPGGADAAYSAGYLQGLTDVLAVIRGVPPAWARKFWPEDPDSP